MKWKTKSGDVMDVKDMSDSHIYNAINYLHKKKIWWEENMVVYFHGAEMLMGDMAQLSVQSEINDNEDLLFEIEEMIDGLEAEQKRRSNNLITQTV